MKIAITGANGWLAKSTYFAGQMLKDYYPELSIELYSRNPQKINLIDGNFVVPKSFKQLSNSEFDLFIPLAFLTREKYFELGAENYQTANLRIIASDKLALQNNPQAKVLLISSGVVKSSSNLKMIDDSFLSYARLKRTQEETYRNEISESNFSICYLYSCTSVDFSKIKGYAFLEFIKKALLNEDIYIQNSASVLRKYIDLRELFFVMLKTIQENKNFNISSSGELVELENLARQIVVQLNSNSKISRAQKNNNDTTDNYFATDETMNSLFSQNKFEYSNLSKQIENVAEVIMKMT